MTNKYVSKAIEKAGGQSALARLVGLRPQAVQRWAKNQAIPANRVIEVEKASGVHRSKLRPDLYPKEAA